MGIGFEMPRFDAHIIAASAAITVALFTLFAWGLST